MSFVVPFDGSALSEAALIKAHAAATGLANAPVEVTDRLPRAGHPIDLVAVVVIPQNARYARKKGWIDADESFEVRTVVDRLRQQVSELVPSAGFEVIRVDSAATSGTISARLRRKAKELGAVMVFIGSENAGRIVSSITSVAGSVAAEDAYDVCLIRHPLPADIESVEDLSEQTAESWFVFPLEQGNTTSSRE